MTCFSRSFLCFK